MSIQSKERMQTFSGLLAGLAPGSLQARGVLDIVPLFPTEARGAHDRYVQPLQHLTLVRVISYGHISLQNTAQHGVLIAPMHVAFFQAGAQNHATSRVVILDKQETRELKDCFCVQASQGGYLKRAQQRFIILPLGLRRTALGQSGQEGFSRLWDDIDKYNRSYGISKGGHLERFLRPYFPRLQPFRHAFEIVPQQVGAAYFVAGKLIGVEVTPNAGYWQDVGPILNIYSYGPAALLAERHELKPARRKLALDGLTNLADLSQRLHDTRTQDEAERLNLLTEMSDLPWKTKTAKREGKQSGVQVHTIDHPEWSGQMVKEGEQVVYLSIFRDL